MKKIFMLFAVCLLFGIGQTYAQNDQAFIGKARGALGACLQNYKSADGWIVEANVYTVGACFVDGFITEVTFTARPETAPCPEGAFCHPPALPIIIGQVRFGCNNEVISSYCL